ncbi:hypothetical protein BU24DRAFT_429182 [Aaosphaeria arxii CBS 175.79]|uniref:Uncharacterized protein n=1 Tax=Aaosphaeria arxii CBS 175.79 TaxID=1450172 RepID=A0A6A5X6S8_9PLEO|nr:uncharacterized protein BU24DRAFT_429182 [Aaosphaeria arxii CBS 175.79]KAF2008586.1 hypothetical protein BU24DRAFT_429182 [Aaosphaeria arxii CBS 175.79]
MCAEGCTKVAHVRSAHHLPVPCTPLVRSTYTAVADAKRDLILPITLENGLAFLLATGMPAGSLVCQLSTAFVAFPYDQMGP